jgi:hypothetical protein
MMGREKSGRSLRECVHSFIHFEKYVYARNRIIYNYIFCCNGPAVAVMLILITQPNELLKWVRCAAKIKGGPSSRTLQIELEKSSFTKKKYPLITQRLLHKVIR